MSLGRVDGVRGGGICISEQWYGSQAYCTISSNQIATACFLASAANRGCPAWSLKTPSWQLQHITIWHLRKLPPISYQPSRNGCKPSKNHCKHRRSRAARPFCTLCPWRHLGHVARHAPQARRHHQRSQGQARHGQQAPALQAGQQRGPGLGRRRRGHCRENCRRRRV